MILLFIVFSFGLYCLFNFLNLNYNQDNNRFSHKELYAQNRSTTLHFLLVDWNSGFYMYFKESTIGEWTVKRTWKASILNPIVRTLLV